MTPRLQQLLALARRWSDPAAAGAAATPLQHRLQDALKAAGLPLQPPEGLREGWARGSWPGAPGFDPQRPLDPEESRRQPPEPHSAPAREAAPHAEGPGQFLAGSHTHQHLTRHHKLYLPAAVASGQMRPRALVVMLHGCTQNPDDFAAGTGMNAQAEAQGFIVLYPEQSQQANASLCWNWFKHNHQQRGRGEAAWLADISQQVASRYRVDPARIFIAGLSAGGAMAASVAAAYPEIFSGVGVHSGLAPGAANNLQQALSAMRSGAAHAATTGVRGEPALAGAQPLPVPAIVFHGDGDTTVHPRNGQQVLAAALASASQQASHAAPQAEAPQQGRASEGRHYTRTCYRRGDGRPLAEHWQVHGAGHAWSGGQAAGSYTDPSGPDATAEMLRFFFSLGD